MSLSSTLSNRTKKKALSRARRKARRARIQFRRAYLYLLELNSEDYKPKHEPHQPLIDDEFELLMPQAFEY